MGAQGTVTVHLLTLEDAHALDRVAPDPARMAARTTVPMARRARARLRCLAAFALLALGSCDLGSGFPPSPSALCETVGAQCALPEGPLGVCERSRCEGGAPPPCFACVPQH